MMNTRCLIPFIAAALLLFSSCQRDKQNLSVPIPRMQSLPHQSTGIRFRNDIAEGKEFNPLTYVYAYNGGGVAAADLDNDGLPELIFTANQQGCTIYKNNGKFHFTDITPKSGIQYRGGWYNGITPADVNADGLIDIYICRSGTDTTNRENLLYINQGNLRFSEQAATYGLNDSNPSNHACFFDYDNDGDLDVFIANHLDNFDFIYKAEAHLDNFLSGQAINKLFQNNNGYFTDVTQASGIPNTLTYSLSVSSADVNHDSYTDLYITNDFFSPDQLLINNGNGTFTDRINQYTPHCSLFAMGSCFEDINNDGYADLMEVDMLPDNHQRLKANLLQFSLNAYTLIHQSLKPKQYIKNMLFVSNAGKSFTDVAEFAGVAATDWSWSVLMEDFDNDTRKDIFIGKGLKRDYFDLDFMTLQNERKRKLGFKHAIDTIYNQMPQVRQPNYLFQNQGNLQFTNAANTWGLKEKLATNGAIAADLDADGNLDLVLNNTDEYASIYKNNTNQTHSLSLIVNSGSRNPNAIGTRVEVYTGNTIQSREISTTRGFLSGSLLPLHFGLHHYSSVDSVKLYLYDKSFTYYKLQADTTYALTAPTASGTLQPPLPLPLAAEAAKPFLDVHHREAPHSDFKNYRTLPFSFSELGPAAQVVDINKDGRDDVFVGGAYNGSVSQLWVQQPDCSFKKLDNAPWEKENIETQHALFADFNNDTYPDLLLSCGTSELASHDTLQNSRLYSNLAGKKFIDATNLLPFIPGIKTTATAFDFDRDGDLDIFTATRMIPGLYPTGTRGYLLENTSKGFRDVTAKKAPILLTLENVTSCALGDLDGDKVSELVVAADWSPIQIFKIARQTIELYPYYLPADSLRGLWRTIDLADIDTDGDLDIIAGNEGLNSYLKATYKEPIELFFNDFDDNGVSEPLLFHYLKGKRHLLYDRNTFCEQMPKFRNKFLTYQSYAYSSPNDIVAQQKINNSKYYHANFLQSIVLKNDKSHVLKYEPLPFKFQLSPINGFTAFHSSSHDGTSILTANNSNNSIYWTSNATNHPSQIFFIPNQHQKNNSQPANIESENNAVSKRILVVKTCEGRQLLYVNNNAPSMLHTIR